MSRRADARADAALGAYAYVDLAGATQGPFAARALARWHEDGFLERALALRRDGDGRETTVGDVVDGSACLTPFPRRLPTRNAGLRRRGDADRGIVSRL